MWFKKMCQVQEEEIKISHRLKRNYIPCFGRPNTMPCPSAHPPKGVPPTPPVEASKERGSRGGVAGA